MSWSLHDERAEHAEPEPDPWVPQSAESHALACATINDVCRELAKRKEDYMRTLHDMERATRPEVFQRQKDARSFLQRFEYLALPYGDGMDTSVPTFLVRDLREWLARVERGEV